MKKFLIPAFVCMAAMFNACGDDNSSSASSESVESSSSEVVDSSSSIAAESSSSEVVESSSSIAAESSSSEVVESSSSESEDILSCDMKINMEDVTSISHVCGEVSATAESKKLFEESCVSGGPLTVVKGTGCPSGAKKVCKDVEAGFAVNLYAYDEDAAKKSCEELLEESFEMPAGEGDK